jgi:hypothetical protein
MNIYDKIFNRINEGLNIFAKYPGATIHAEHDVIYAGCDGDDESYLSEEDKNRLMDLGWSRNDEGGWEAFT